MDGGTEYSMLFFNIMKRSKGGVSSRVGNVAGSWF